MVTKSRIFTVGALSCAVVISSVLWTSVKIHQLEDLQQPLSFGWPFSFVEQNQSIPPPSLPWSQRFYSPWENPTSILWSRFMLSLAVIFVSIFLMFELLIVVKKHI